MRDTRNRHGEIADVAIEVYGIQAKYEGDREGFKEFLSRPQCTITKLKSLGVEMSEDMIPRKSAQALRLAEWELSIALSASETTGGNIIKSHA